MLFAYFYYYSSKQQIESDNHDGHSTSDDDGHSTSDDDGHIIPVNKLNCVTSIACFPNACINGKCSIVSDLTPLIVIVQANIRNFCDSLNSLSARSPEYFKNVLTEIDNVQKSVTTDCNGCIPDISIPFSGVDDNLPNFNKALNSLVDLNLCNNLSNMLKLTITSDFNSVKSNLDAILNIDIGAIIQNMFHAMDGMWGYEYIHTQNFITKSASKEYNIIIPLPFYQYDEILGDYYALVRYVRWLLIIHDLIMQVGDNAIILINSVNDTKSTLMKIYNS
jgi:hypothetical protein